GRGDLATIGATYHSSSPGRGELEGRMAVAPWQSGVGLALSRLAAPLSRTEYVFTPSDARWLQMVVVNEQEFAGFTSGDWLAPPPSYTSRRPASRPSRSARPPRPTSW